MCAYSVNGYRGQWVANPRQRFMATITLLYFLTLYLMSLNTLVLGDIECSIPMVWATHLQDHVQQESGVSGGAPVDGLCPSLLTFCYLVAPAEAHDHEVAKGDGCCSLLVAWQEVDLLGHSKPVNLVFIDGNTHLCISLSHIICNQLN